MNTVSRRFTKTEGGSLCVAIVLIPAVAPAFNLHAHTHTMTNTHTHRHAHTLTHTLRQTLKSTHSFTHSVTHSYTHSHTDSLTHSYTHSHTHTHSGATVLRCVPGAVVSEERGEQTARGWEPGAARRASPGVRTFPLSSPLPAWLINTCTHSHTERHTHTHTYRRTRTRQHMHTFGYTCMMTDKQTRKLYRNL